MAMAVNFRWRSSNLQAAQPNSVKNGWAQSLTQAATAISDMKNRRFNKEQAERRNRIEDEDRARRIDEEERRKKVYGDAADMMRGKAQERAALVQEAEKLRSEIAELKARIGG